MADYKRRSKEHDVDGYFKGKRRRERYSRDFTTDFNTDIQPRQSEETRVYRREQEMLIAYENDPGLIRRKAMYQAGVTMIQRKEQEKEQASILISKHTTFGFLDESALGKELLGLALENKCSFVEAVINELGSTDRDDVSFEVVSHADQGALKTIAGSVDGIDLIVRLFDELTSGSINDDEQEQANRLMFAIANTLPVEQFPQSLSHIKIFPHKDIHGIGPGGSSISYAKPAGGGKIRVQMSFRFREFPEGRTLPQEVMYPEGVLLDANEIVGIRMYDEGGDIIFRPAIFLVQCANKTDAHYMQLYAEAAVMGVTLGTSAVASGSIRGGLTLTQKILSILDKTATGVYVTTRLVQENRGWIIAKFGNSGRKFIHYTELINNAMMIYGGVRLVTSLGKLVYNWRKAYKNFKKQSKGDLDADQLKALDKLDEQIEVLNHYYDDLLKGTRLGRYEGVIRNGKFVPTKKIEVLVRQFENQGGKIIVVNKFQPGRGNQVFGGFDVIKGKPTIVLFKGADEATFIHEFVHFRQARLKGLINEKGVIVDMDKYKNWKKTNEKFLEAQVDFVLDQLGYKNK